MSYTINLQHIVFRTKYSRPAIPDESKRQMLAYINEDSRRLGVKIIRINAYRNHIHLLVDLGANTDISSFVKTIKADSSRAFHHHHAFPTFEGWARRYGSFSISRWDKDTIVNYIRLQEEHHRIKTFAEELTELFGEDITNDVWWRKDWLDESINPDENTNAVPPALAE